MGPRAARTTIDRRELRNLDLLPRSAGSLPGGGSVDTGAESGGMALSEDRGDSGDGVDGGLGGLASGASHGSGEAGPGVEEGRHSYDSRSVVEGLEASVWRGSVGSVVIASAGVGSCKPKVGNVVYGVYVVARLPWRHISPDL